MYEEIRLRLAKHFESKSESVVPLSVFLGNAKDLSSTNINQL